MSVWDESPLPPPVGPAAPPPGDPAASPASVPPAPPTGPADPPGGPPGDGPDDDGSRRRILGGPARLAAVVLALCAVVAVVVFATRSDDGSPATDAADATAPRTEVDPATSPVTAAPITSAPATAPATTAPATSATSTTTTTTTAAPTTTSTAATTTIGDQPGVSIAGPTSVTDVDGRRLTVTPRVDACRGGPDCLVVAFAIEGFPSQPTTFVCEFASGSRFQFRFGTDRVETACSTGDTPDSIVVEVDGLRSEPITISD